MKIQTLAAVCLCFAVPLFSQKTIAARTAWHNGRATIFINDMPIAPIFYALTDVPGGRRSWEEVPQHNIRRFCEDGIRLYQVDVFLEQLWPSEQVFSLDYAQRQVRGVLEVCPDAAVFIRMHLNAPRWWVEKHPEENVAYDGPEAPSPDVNDGLSRFVEADPRNPVRTSLLSQIWQAHAAEKLAQFCHEFSKTVEGQSLAGIHVAAGVYGEWHQWGFLNWEADFGQAAREGFRADMAELVERDELLQKRWGQTDARLDNLRVPDTKERAQVSGGLLRDPKKEQHVIDYYRFQHETIASCINVFCRTIKAEWPRPIITGAFYGYFFSCFGRQTAGGHLALSQLLGSPFVDYLAGPQAYLPEAERPGEPYRSRSLTLSMRLNKKLWLDEMDQQPRRTFAYIEGIKDNRSNYEAAIRENVAQLRRNLMFSHSKGQGFWLYDFGLAGMDLNGRAERSPQWGSQGYWDHPAYHEVVRDIKKIYDQTLEQPYRSEADVLFVYDNEVFYHTQSTVADPDSLSLQLVDFMSLAAYYAGAIFDAVQLDDLGKVNLSAYKTIVFANTLLLDETEKTFIREKVAREGRHIVWLCAPGYGNGQSLDPVFVSETSGFQLTPMPPGSPALVEMDKQLGDSIFERAPNDTRPLFSIRDADATVLGRFRHNGAPAFARKKMADCTLWFSSVPLLDWRTWRHVFGAAGAHLYDVEQDIFYGGGGILTFHTKQGGLKKITLKNGKEVILDLPPGPATVLLDTVTGDRRQ